MLALNVVYKCGDDKDLHKSGENVKSAKYISDLHAFQRKIKGRLAGPVGDDPNQTKEKKPDRPPTGKNRIRRARKPESDW